MSRPHADESVFRAIADPTRRRIIDLLRARDRSVLDLIEALGISRPTLSHHLNILRIRGVIAQRREGRRRRYRLHPESLRIPVSWLTRPALRSSHW